MGNHYSLGQIEMDVVLEQDYNTCFWACWSYLCSTSITRATRTTSFPCLRKTEVVNLLFLLSSNNSLKSTNLSFNLEWSLPHGKWIFSWLSDVIQGHHLEVKISSVGSADYRAIVAFTGPGAKSPVIIDPVWVLFTGHAHTELFVQYLILFSMPLNTERRSRKAFFTFSIIAGLLVFSNQQKFVPEVPICT